MKVSKKLIERYHLGRCSYDEEEAVEQWLLDTQDTPLFPEGILDKETTKVEIWEQLRRDTLQAAARKGKRLSAKRYLKVYAGAAAIALLLLTTLFWNQKPTAISTAELARSTKITGLNTELFDIELGRESEATFDSKNELLDFCGIIKITPKKSMRLSFANFCGSHDELKKEVNVTGGTTYFALDLKNNEHTELLVMDEDLLFELPLLLRNSLISEFGI